MPDGISDATRGAETVRLILRNLSALTQYLAELRGLYGSGHGRDGKHRGLQPRHARLAVGAAVAFIDFVTETHRDRGPRQRRRQFQLIHLLSSAEAERDRRQLETDALKEARRSG